MDYADTMCRIQCETGLANGFDRLFSGELALLDEQPPQVCPFDKLHGDELDSVNVRQIVDPDYVLVSHLMREQKFLLKARHNGGIRSQVAADQLQGDEAVEFAVLRFVHRAHSAF